MHALPLHRQQQQQHVRRSGSVLAATRAAHRPACCRVQLHHSLLRSSSRFLCGLHDAQTSLSLAPACLLSGDMPQAERLEAIAAVRSFSVRVIVSTDLVARGVDLGEAPPSLRATGANM